jgi:hypothetical protein
MGWGGNLLIINYLHVVVLYAEHISPHGNALLNFFGCFTSSMLQDSVRLSPKLATHHLCGKFHCWDSSDFMIFLLINSTIPPEMRISRNWEMIHEMAAPYMPHRGMNWKFMKMQTEPTISPMIGAYF